MPNKPTDGERKGGLEALQEELLKREEEAKALRTALGFTKRSFHESPVGMAIYDVESGRCISANEAIAGIIGTSSEQVLAQDFRTIPSWQESGLLDQANEALREGTKKHLEVGVTSTFGKEISIDCHFTPLEAEDRQYLMVSVWDITKRWEAEKALAQKTLMLENLLRSTTDVAIATTDLDRRITYFNPSAENLFGLSAEQVLGRTVSEIHAIGGVNPERLTRAFENVRDQGQHSFSFSRETQGGLRHLEARIAGIFDADGASAGFSLFVHDATERLQSDEEKLLMERQAQQAQKMDSLGALAGGIAHDFNNLLLGILGNAELALDMLKPDSPVASSIRGIQDASKRAGDLVTQMLAYSGKGQLQIEPIHANDLIQQTSQLLDASISKKASLQLHFTPDLPTFDGDASHVRQVLMNLVINASEAIGDRSGTITLDTGVMECDEAYLSGTNEVLLASLGEPLPEGPYVYLDISDTGQGMDDETAEKVFDPFFTTKFAGRGLGMSAVLGIVRRHRGSLIIDSAPGKGTKVRVLFPANERAEAPAAAVEVAQTTPEEEWRGSGTLLLADDEMAVLLVGKRMLERIGFRVLTASDGREALRAARDHKDRITGVLLDLTMPQMDGWETFGELRRLYPHLPVILCSGFGEREATQRFVGQGLAGFLHKPFKMMDLRNTLSAVFEKEGGGGPTAGRLKE